MNTSKFEISFDLDQIKTLHNAFSRIAGAVEMKVVAEKEMRYTERSN